MSEPSEERSRARARLALRAERAMGVKSVRGKIKGKRAAASAVSPASAVMQPQRTPIGSLARSPRAIEATAQATPPTAMKRAAPALGVTPPRAPLIDNTPFTGDPLPTAQKIIALKTLNETQVIGCVKCRLSETRTHTVFGEGAASARLMFIGEGPGENEDLAGRPFIGKAGQLLEKMIQAMGLSREQVYICNIVKCRPPNNRQPAADETAACTPYLLEQVSTIRPEVIVTLGLPSTQYILSTKNSMSKMRGQWHSWRGVKVMPTYHPAYVLRQYTPQTREAVWSDLKLVLAELKLPLPRAKGAT